MFIKCLAEVLAVFGTRLKGFIASRMWNFEEQLSTIVFMNEEFYFVVVISFNPTHDFVCATL